MSQISTHNPLESAARPIPNQFSEMSSEDFIKIIFTELSQQDPLKPNDSTALLEQLSTIRSIESDIKLTEQLDQLVQGNQLASAGNLIGKFIGGLSQNFQSVAGWVVAAMKQGDSIFLELDTGFIVPFENVQTVIDPSLLPDEPSPPDEPEGTENDEGGDEDDVAGAGDDDDDAEGEGS